jgi:hypothetical protein
MNKTILTSIVLSACFASVSGQVAVPDTAYVYETVIVYDTIRISDTIRVKKAVAPAMHPKGDSSIFFTPPAATISKNDIILHENNHQKNVHIMKFHTTNYLNAFILTAQSMAGLSAQEPATDHPEKFPAQITIVYPMSTQGHRSVDYHYHFSFNLFTGKVGAVTGFEFGSFLNRVEHEVKGVQLSGLFNLAQKASGIQFGGIGNASKAVNGIQLGGLGNITGEGAGIQFGGIGNISESVNGIQLGGLVNINKRMHGLQFAGITNLCEDNKGIQLAGITNVTGGSRGFQLAGAVNVTGESSGIQLAGITNVTGESTGFQFAGAVNVNNKVSGASFGGLFNRTGALHGFQFGIVNVIDSVESGVSLAIINIVKKGFHREWSLTFADYLNVGLSYKMGTQKLYTILSVGANFMEDKLWATGIGFGNRTPLGRRIDFQPEIVTYNYYPDDFKNTPPTWSTHLKFGFVYKLNEKLGIVVAPGIYQLYREWKGGQTCKISPVKELYSKEKDNKLHTIGMGISVGLVLK